MDANKNLEEAIKKICSVKLKLAGQISFYTRRLIMERSPEGIAELLEKRDTLINSLESYDKKINNYFNLQGKALNYPEKFRKEYSGIILSILHNNDQIYRRQKKLKDELAKKLAEPVRGRVAAKYLAAP